jgi:nucleoside-diphosphate kinase
VASRTLAIFKPDAVRRQLVGNLFSAVEHYGFKILHMEIGEMSYSEAARLYKAQHEGQPYYGPLCTFLSTGQSIVLILEGHDAVNRWRNIMGPAKPEARASWTIRGALCEGFPMMENLVHGSDSEESFVREAQAFGLSRFIQPTV